MKINERTLYKKFVSNVSSLIIQTTQVGAALTIMLLLTDGKPSPLILGGSVFGGVVFVTFSEVKRLTKEKNESSR